MTPRPLALDSSCLVAWIRQEPNWKAIHTLLTNPAIQPVMLGPTVSEVISLAKRGGNTAPAGVILLTLRANRCIVELSTEDDLVRAAELHALSEANPQKPPPGAMSQRPRTLSMADAQILAMAEARGMGVVTRDSYWKWFVQQVGLNIAIARY